VRDIFTDPPELFDEEGDSMAFGVGLGHGFRRFSPRPNSTVAVANNKYYYYPGYIIGYLLKIMAAIGLIYAVFDGGILSILERFGYGL